MAGEFTPEQLQQLTALLRPPTPFDPFQAPAERAPATVQGAEAAASSGSTDLPIFPSPQGDAGRAQQLPLRPDGKPQHPAGAMPAFKLPPAFPQIPYDILSRMQVGQVAPGLQEAQAKMAKLLQVPSTVGKPVGGIPLPGTRAKF